MSQAPTTVQQWVESLPCPGKMFTSPVKTPMRKFMAREVSLQSDDASSLCSSVESVLELRKPDPEAVLLELGFGPTKNNTTVSRIPARFLQPSKLLPHIDVTKIVQQDQEFSYPNQHSTAPPVRGPQTQRLM